MPPPQIIDPGWWSASAHCVPRNCQGGKKNYIITHRREPFLFPDTTKTKTKTYFFKKKKKPTYFSYRMDLGYCHR